LISKALSKPSPLFKYVVQNYSSLHAVPELATAGTRETHPTVLHMQVFKQVFKHGTFGGEGWPVNMARVIYAFQAPKFVV
jgi:hypothetical protein